MKRFLALAMFLATTSGATAWEPYCSMGSMPPPRFTGVEPVRPYHVIYLPLDLIVDLCRDYAAPKKLAPVGCTSEERPGEFWIYIENHYQSRAEQLCTLWHEKAHIAGWEHPAYFSGPIYHSRRKGIADLIYGPPVARKP